MGEGDDCGDGDVIILFNNDGDDAFSRKMSACLRSLVCGATVLQ